MKTTTTRPCILLLFCLQSFFLYGQTDTLRLKNGDQIIGEIKSMSRGILQFEADYSDSDFKIEWEKIEDIYSVTPYLISLTSGNRYNGILENGPEGAYLINLGEDGRITADPEEIIYLKSVRNAFASRFDASIDFGFSFTKASNLRQTNLSTRVSFLQDKWTIKLNYSLVTSNQDEVDPIRRAEGGLTFRYYLPKDWYYETGVNTYSSTEQLIDLRTNINGGGGKYLINTNHAYWLIGIGLSFNNENFAEQRSDRQSLEGFFGTELNLYDFGDFELFAKGVIFPSFTERGRLRAEVALNAKYDLPHDFYIRFGYNLNFDNQPEALASQSDYVIQSGIGWEF